MTIIHSRDNTRYKSLQRIASGKRPLGGGPKQVWIEGVHLCQSWLERFGAPDMVVFDAERAESTPEIQALLEQAHTAERCALSSALLRSLSKVEQPQGIAFAVSMPTQSPDGPLDGAALLLDRIQDPGNLGTLLRTAAAADIGQVFLSEGCADVWSQKVLRSAQGAHFNLSLYEQVDLHHLIRHSKVQVFATSLDDAQSLYQIRIPSSAAWVFGNEGQGVEAALQQKATARVFIPQSARVESLNVAIAAGICLFEQRRQSLA